jgi:hypothetical protein
MLWCRPRSRRGGVQGSLGSVRRFQLRARVGTPSLRLRPPPRRTGQADFRHPAHREGVIHRGYESVRPARVIRAVAMSCWRNSAFSAMNCSRGGAVAEQPDDGRCGPGGEPHVGVQAPDHSTHHGANAPMKPESTTDVVRDRAVTVKSCARLIPERSCGGPRSSHDGPFRDSYGRSCAVTSKISPSNTEFNDTDVALHGFPAFDSRTSWGCGSASPSLGDRSVF